MKQTISEGINFNFLLRDVYVTNCYFRLSGNLRQI